MIIRGSMAAMFINPYLLHIYYTKYEYITLFANYCIIRFNRYTNIEYSIFQYLKFDQLSVTTPHVFFRRILQKNFEKSMIESNENYTTWETVRLDDDSRPSVVLFFHLRNTERNNFQRKGGISNKRNSKQFRVGYRKWTTRGPRKYKIRLKRLK